MERMVDTRSFGIGVTLKRGIEYRGHRSWLFSNFLVPYPGEKDKRALSCKTGLTPSQVMSKLSNTNRFVNIHLKGSLRMTPLSRGVSGEKALNVMNAL